MRVAFVIDRFQPGKGGLEGWLSAFGSHLERAGHDAHLLTRDRAVECAPFLHHALVPSGMRRAVRDRRFAEAARNVCRDEGFDVVVGLRHCLECDVYYPHGGTAVATFANHRRSSRVRNFLRLERDLLAGDAPPRRVVAVSEMVRRDVEEHYPSVADRVEVVPNGVDLSRFRPGGRERARKELVPGGGTTVAFVAGNPELKGWKAVREVFRRLRADGAADHLLVAGGRPGRMPPGGRFLGRTDRPEDVLKASDLLLYPTRYDPFPLVVLEALACGTPVATTERNGALDHVGRDGPVRAVEDPADVDGLHSISRRLLEDRPRAEARSRAEELPLAGSLDRAAEVVLRWPRGAAGPYHGAG